MAHFGGYLRRYSGRRSGAADDRRQGGLCKANRFPLFGISSNDLGIKLRRFWRTKLFITFSRAYQSLRCERSIGTGVRGDSFIKNDRLTQIPSTLFLDECTLVKLHGTLRRARHRKPAEDRQNEHDPSSHTRLHVSLGFSRRAYIESLIP